MRPATRWLVPAGVGLLVAGGAVAGTLAAGASVDLPDRTPAEVLALAQQAEVRSLSGTVEVAAELGLPEFLTGGDGAHADAGLAGDGPAGELLGLLSGDTTVRLWADGHERLRLQVLDQLAETDVVRNGQEVWTYSSRTDTATRATLPQKPDGATEPPASTLTPQQLADRALAAVEPTTEVRVEEGVRVAGRDAYVLVLEPRSAESLVGSVALAVDGETGMALDVRVSARGRQLPALAVGFSDLELGPPDPAVFDFSPPPGATVEEAAAWPGHDRHADDEADHTEAPVDGQRPTVVGEGWTTVVVAPGTPPADELLAAGFTPVDGGRLLTTALFSVLVTDDGRTLAGAVTPGALEAAAAP